MLVRTLDEIGRLVRQRRREFHLTQAQLASQAQTTRHVISRLETGKGDVGTRLLLRILDALQWNLELRLPRTWAPSVGPTLLSRETLRALDQQAREYER